MDLSTRTTFQVAFRARPPGDGDALASSPGISMRRPRACWISSATSMPVAAGTPAFAPAPSGCPGASASTLGARPERRCAWRARFATLPRLAQAPRARRALVRQGPCAHRAWRRRRPRSACWPSGRAGTAEHVERIVRGWRRMDRKAERDEATRQHASRALHVYPAEDGTVTIRGRLSPEAGRAPPARPWRRLVRLCISGSVLRRLAPSERTFPRKRADDGSAAGRRAARSGRDRRLHHGSRSGHAGRALPGGGPRRRARSWRTRPARPVRREDGAARFRGNVAAPGVRREPGRDAARTADGA